MKNLFTLSLFISFASMLLSCGKSDSPTPATPTTPTTSTTTTTPGSSMTTALTTSDSLRRAYSTVLEFSIENATIFKESWIGAGSEKAPVKYNTYNLEVVRWLIVNKDYVRVYKQPNGDQLLYNKQKFDNAYYPVIGANADGGMNLTMVHYTEALFNFTDGSTSNAPDAGKTVSFCGLNRKVPSGMSFRLSYMK